MYRCTVLYLYLPVPTCTVSYIYIGGKCLQYFAHPVGYWHGACHNLPAIANDPAISPAYTPWDTALLCFPAHCSTLLAYPRLRSTLPWHGMGRTTRPVLPSAHPQAL